MIAHSGFSAAVALWFGLLFAGIAAVLPDQTLAETFGLTRPIAVALAAIIGGALGLLIARIMRAVRRRSLVRYDFVPASEPPRWTLRGDDPDVLPEAEDDEEEPLFKHFSKGGAEEVDAAESEPPMSAEAADPAEEALELRENWEAEADEDLFPDDPFEDEAQIAHPASPSDEDKADEGLAPGPHIDSVLAEPGEQPHATHTAEADDPESAAKLLEEESLARLVQRLEEAVARLSERDERIQNAGRADLEPAPRPQSPGKFSGRRESLGPFRMQTRVRSRRDNSQ